MSNKALLDSSILIEYRKGSNKDLLNAMIKDPNWMLYVNQTIVSEYLFHHLAIFGGKAPRTLKESGAIGAILQSHDPLPFLNLFEWLSDEFLSAQWVVEMMIRYNLLPNDARIICSSMQHGFEAFVSLDPDFVQPCLKENLVLIQSLADFTNFQQPKGI